MNKDFGYGVQIPTFLRNSESEEDCDICAWAMLHAPDDLIINVSRIVRDSIESIAESHYFPNQPILVIVNCKFT